MSTNVGRFTEIALPVSEDMMTDILLGHSCYLRFDAKSWQAMQPYPPIGTMLAAAVMRQQGYSVALFDATLAESEEQWAAALDRYQPRYAIIYEDNFNYLSKMCLLTMRQAAFSMVHLARERDCITILCGSDATDHAEAYLAAGADYVLLGEGEATLLELVAALDEGAARLKPAQCASIMGLAYQTPTGPERSPRRRNIEDVDGLPFPAWDLVDVERYRQIWLTHHGYYSMNMVTSRGCPYHCNWCAKPIWGQYYRSRSPENVVRELKWLKETYHPDHIWFADDLIELKPVWWETFARLVAEQEARVPFKCLSRADLIARDVRNVIALADSGCDIVWLGAESGSQKILDSMEKGMTVEQVYQAAHLLHNAGLRVGFFLQFGYPGETRADIEKTLQMVRDCRPDDVGMSVSYPLPGTRFYESVGVQLGDKQNWTDSSDLAMMYRGPFVTGFYRQLHTVLHKEFRARRGWQALRQVAGKPRRWRFHHLREALAIGYRLATLPLARRNLDRLEHVPHNRLAPPPHMSLAEASQPSPQSEQ
jgi:anaerobic magnesium-protoporphyrin IX monomethyl ester cyclase